MHLPLLAKFLSVSLLCWHGVDSALSMLNVLRSIKTLRELSVEASLKWVILFQLTSLSVGPLVSFPPVTVGKGLIAVIRAELFTTMPHRASSGWRIKYLWELVASEQYRQECIVKGQTQSFSGIGAQHQNNRVPNSECFILVTIACAFSCKLKRECQHVPNRESGLTPMEFGHGRGHGRVRDRGRGNGRGRENGVGNNNAYDNNDDGSLPPPVNVPEGAEGRRIDAGPCWSGRQRKPCERLIESCNIRAVEVLSSNFEFRADGIPTIAEETHNNITMPAPEERTEHYESIDFDIVPPNKQMNALSNGSPGFRPIQLFLLLRPR